MAPPTMPQRSAAPFDIGRGAYTFRAEVYTSRVLRGQAVFRDAWTELMVPPQFREEFSRPAPPAFWPPSLPLLCTAEDRYTGRVGYYLVLAVVSDVLLAPDLRDPADWCLRVRVLGSSPGGKGAPFLWQHVETLKAIGAGDAAIAALLEEGLRRLPREVRRHPWRAARNPWR